MKKYKVGYTQGCFDMFHIGHLNLINNAKKYCDKLVVGVNTDELVYSYKNKLPVVNEKNRQEILNNIENVNFCILARTLDKKSIYEFINFDVIFIGDDWKGNERWLKTEEELSEYGVDVVYLPHTPNISSTELKKIKFQRL